tara:strand:+ start:8209 stop:8355 length:147 start_codon:yes stop_codon:yes gene_type:complete
MLDDFVPAMILKGNRPATINRKLRALSTAMTVAIDRDGLCRKPMFPWQ